MKPIERKLKAFIAEESGATLVEYGMALLVVIVVGTSSIYVLGDSVAGELRDTASAF